jgi:hypothetical protein
MFFTRITYQGGKMQRVVRLSFAGLLAFAGAALTACGDKVTIPPANAVDSVVHSVTVSPPSASVAIGGSIQLGVSVDAGAGVTVRTVSWSSSDNGVATVDQTGKVLGVKAGTASIVAKSTQDPSVSGAAVITVTGAGTVTVSLGQIAQNPNGNIVDLSDVHNQIDVTVNLDAQGGQTVAGVDLVMNCNAAGGFPAASDTIVATQNISTGNVAPVSAEAAAAPITMSFNTANFNKTTGAVSFKNGQCVLRAKVRTGSGTQVASSNTALTLNNDDVVIVKTTNGGATAADANGVFWKSGSVTVAATPVLYTGTTISSANITLPGATTPTQTGITLSSGVASATWAGTGTTGPRVTGLTLGTSATPITATVTFVDSQGNVLTPAQTNALTEAQIRVDNQAPPAAAGVNVIYTPNTQNTANNWVGKAFKFTSASAITLDAAALADNAGVGKVTFATQWSPTGAGTWTTFTDVNTLAETSTSTAYDLRSPVCDALNNCANSGVLTQFGVDLTVPTASTGTGPKANEIVGIAGALSATNVGVLAGDPQGAGGVTGSGFGGTPVLVSETRIFPSGASGQQQACTIGTNGTGGVCTAPSAQPLTFAVTTTDPGQYALSYTVIDQAGNTAPAVTSAYYIDNTAAPAISGGISIPASIVVGQSFMSSGVDNMDFASAQAFLHYGPVGLPAGLTGRIIFPATSTAAGVAFDNTLSRTSNLTATLGSQFYRSLNTIAAGAIANPIVKPDTVGIRGTDAANNLSAPNAAALPAANIANGTTLAVGTDLTDFTISSDAATINVGGTGTPKSATLSAVVTATGPTAGTPFNSVCFYIEVPAGTGAENGQASKALGAAAGDLVLLNCTPTTITTGPTPKLITSTFTWTPSAAFAPVGGQAYNLYAVGVTTNGDAILTTATAITVNP